MNIAEIINTICEQRRRGVPMRTILAVPGMPNWRTVRRWKREDPDFAAAIEMAGKDG